LAKIDSVYDFSDKALVELKSWLEPWFLTRCPCGAAHTAFADAIFHLAATRDLRGYWRLGDGASPFADTSGYGSPGADAVKTSTGTAMTDSIVGALPPADDDGAVQFNNASGGAGDYLDVPMMTPARFDFSTGTSALTLAAWVNPTASASTFNGDAVASWYDTGFGNSGWRLGVQWPARLPFFQRREQGTPPGSATLTGLTIAAGHWSFVVGTYDPTDGHFLYVNGTAVAADATVFNNLQAGSGPNFGRNGASSAPFDGFYGGVDEVSIWGVALTGAEVATLYTSGI
jgi:hypothetical protein